MKFDNNTYMKTLQAAELASSEYEIRSKITENKELQFTYYDVEYDQFLQNYDSKGWRARKITAIPQAFWCGLVKTIYHFTNALFVGSFKAIFDKGTYFKAQIFNTARDSEEAFGHLATLVKDSNGLFHIEKSCFQKACYELALNRNREQNRTFNKEEITGTRFSNLSPELKSKLLSGINDGTYNINHLPVNDVLIALYSGEITNLSDVGDPLLQNLDFDRLSDQQVSTFLRENANDLERRFAVCPINRLQRFLESDVAKQSELTSMPNVQLNQITFSQVPKIVFDRIFPASDTSSKIRFANLNQTQVKELIENPNLRMRVFELLSDDQWKSITVSDLANDDLRDIFVGYLSDNYLECKRRIDLLSTPEFLKIRKANFFSLAGPRIGAEASLKERLEKLDSNQIKEFVEDRVLTGEDLRILSDEQLKQVPLEKLAYQDFAFIFGSEITREITLSMEANSEGKRRFQLFGEDAIQKLLSANKSNFPKRLFEYFSDEQWRSLKISEVDPVHYSKMFPDLNPLYPGHKDGVELERRVAFFSIAELEKVWNQKLPIWKEVFRYLSEPQMEAIVEGIDPNQVKATVEDGRLRGSLLAFLTDEQVKMVPLAKLNVIDFMGLFKNTYLEHVTVDLKDKQRFASFSQDTVQDLLRPKNFMVISVFIKLLSDDQWRSLNLLKIDPEVIPHIFDRSQFSDDEFKKRIALFSIQDLQALINRDLLEEYWVKGALTPEQERELKFPAKRAKTRKNTFPWNSRKDLSEFSEMSLKEIERLFPDHEGNIVILADNQKRFESIPIEELRKALNKNILNERLMNLISPKQRQKLGLPEEVNYDSTAPFEEEMDLEGAYKLLGINVDERATLTQDILSQKFKEVLFKSHSDKVEGSKLDANKLKIARDRVKKHLGL